EERKPGSPRIAASCRQLRGSALPPPSGRAAPGPYRRQDTIPDGPGQPRGASGRSTCFQEAPELARPATAYLEGNGPDLTEIAPDNADSRSSNACPDEPSRREPRRGPRSCRRQDQWPEEERHPAERASVAKNDRDDSGSCSGSDDRGPGATDLSSVILRSHYWQDGQPPWPPHLEGGLVDWGGTSL